MTRSSGESPAVAVVRVLIRPGGGSGALLFELLEVGRNGVADRPIGRSTTVLGACTVLERWLTSLVDPDHALRDHAD